MNDLFRGELVRLSAEEPEFQAKQEALWRRDTEFHRLADSDPASVMSVKKIQTWLEKNIEGVNPERYPFGIRALADDKLIGFMGLWLSLIHSEAWVGIAIGERDYWGKGYGTEAMNILLRYSFVELGLWRVSLGVFEYNPRAIRSYEKAGFQHEGRVRGGLFREGRRWDLFFMGILRDDWLKKNQ